MLLLSLPASENDLRPDLQVCRAQIPSRETVRHGRVGRYEKILNALHKLLHTASINIVEIIN